MPVSLNRKLLVITALAAMTLASYWRVTNLSFVNYDDNLYVTENPHVQAGLTSDSVGWALTTVYAANWHPVTWVSHQIDCELYGMSPAGPHLTNLALHLGNVLLLFWLLQLMTGAVWRSAFVAGLFGVHPLSVESVAWVAERKNVLSTLFFMLTILAYTRYARRPTWRRFLPVVVPFALGLMAKPMLVTLPFLLLLLDYWPLGRWASVRFESVAIRQSPGSLDLASDNSPSRERPYPSRKFGQLVLEKTPLLALSFVSCIATVIAQHKWGAVMPLNYYPFSLRLENALTSYAKYLENMVWPARLAVVYPLQASIPLWHLGLAAAVLLSVTGLVIWGVRRSKYLAVGWLWYLGTLIPVIGLIQAGSQSMADRYAYLPMIGMFIMAVWGFAEFGQRLRVRGLGPIGLFVLMLLAIMTSQQVRYWHDDISLFQHAQSVTGDNSIASDMLGNDFAMEGNFDQAIAEFSKIPESDPSYCKAQSSVGMMLVQKGDLSEAVTHFKLAINASPQYSDAYNRLGAVLMEQGRTDEAIPYLQQALEFSPNHASACANLGAAYDQKGNLDLAMSYYSRALELTIPYLNSNGARQARGAAAQINCRIGDLLARSGRAAEAVDRYRDALRLDPACAPAAQRLSTLPDAAQPGSGTLR